MLLWKNDDVEICRIQLMLPAETILNAESVLPWGDRLFVTCAICFIRVTRPIDLANPIARVATESLVTKMFAIQKELLHQ